MHVMVFKISYGLFFCLLLFTELNEMHLVCIITLNMRPEKVDVLFHFCLLSLFYQNTVVWGKFRRVLSLLCDFQGSVNFFSVL